MNKPERIHTGGGVSLLLRLPSVGTSIEEVAEAHNSVVAKNGSVWLGIVGKIYSAESIRHIREHGEFLYLVQNVRNKISVYKSKMSDITHELPQTQHSLVPAYYYDLGIAARAKIWVKLSSLKPVGAEEIETLRVVSSRKKASVLLTGMAYVGIVERESNP